MAKGYLGKNESEKIKLLLEGLKLGMPVKHACDSAGISESGFYKYLQKAEKDIEDGKRTKYVAFLESVKKAKSEFIRNNMAIIQRSAVKGNWQASAWLLERRCPDDFGLRAPANQEQQENIEYVSDVPSTTKNN